eukprot:CAMPEP_0172838042 /NCGR_PEP_ID=MMETSP1075-20121228/27599_1 /TAXON_ID=2916 /ORGANISM="Ceratium fusus, Strain PA161109" /LENGTH=102 /DNA_ID=CAMNT_0013681499 /DNA_START=415 /DNA_END=723 /DNA_ORIENTATION=+
MEQATPITRLAHHARRLQHKVAATARGFDSETSRAMKLQTQVVQKVDGCEVYKIGRFTVVKQKGVASCCLLTAEQTRSERLPAKCGEWRRDADTLPPPRQAK